MFLDDLIVIDTVGTDCVNIQHAPNVLRVQHDSALRMVEGDAAHIKDVIRVQGTSTSVRRMAEEGAANQMGVVSQLLEVQTFVPVMVVVVGVLWMVVESRHNLQRNSVSSMVEGKNAHILAAIR